MKENPKVSLALKRLAFSVLVGFGTGKCKLW
jgi:hypothetical protein